MGCIEWKLVNNGGGARGDTLEVGYKSVTVLVLHGASRTWLWCDEDDGLDSGRLRDIFIWQDSVKCMGWI